jgi:hypothetical protein
MTGRQVQKRDDGDSEICKRSKLQKADPCLVLFLPGVDLRSIETALQAAWHHNPCKDTSGLAGSFEETLVQVTNRVNRSQTRRVVHHQDDKAGRGTESVDAAFESIPCEHDGQKWR